MSAFQNLATQRKQEQMDFDLTLSQMSWKQETSGNFNLVEVFSCLESVQEAPKALGWKVMCTYGYSLKRSWESTWFCGVFCRIFGDTFPKSVIFMPLGKNTTLIPQSSMKPVRWERTRRDGRFVRCKTLRDIVQELRQWICHCRPAVKKTGDAWKNIWIEMMVNFLQAGNLKL